MEKKAKAEAKRTRRNKLKQAADAGDAPQTPLGERKMPDDEPEAPHDAN